MANDTLTTRTPALDRVSEARAAVLMGVPAMAIFVVFVFAMDRFGLLRFELRVVSPILVALMLLNMIAVPTAWYWGAWAGAVYAWEGLYAVALALMIWADLRVAPAVPYKLAILLNTYIVLVIHTQTFRADASPLATATICAVCYGLLGIARWITGTGSNEEMAFIIAGSLALYFVAIYVLVYGRRLRYLASHLQQLVTERTEALTVANRELGAQTRALEVRQQDLRELVYAVTHDLKTPVGAIHLIADLMQRRGRGARGPADRDDVERIMHLAEGTEDMIRDLLGLFRITSAEEQPAWVPLDVLVAQALEQLEPQIAAKGTRVTMDPLPRAFGQREQLAHVVRNLLSNAVKYVPSRSGKIHVSGWHEDGTVCLAVRDNGIGIAAEYHRGIFELFGRVPEHEQRVDGEPVGGTGVGLAIVKRVVEGHGGTVWVESAPGTGSLFGVRLPDGSSTGDER